MWTVRDNVSTAVYITDIAASVIYNILGVLICSMCWRFGRLVLHWCILEVLLYSILHFFATWSWGIFICFFYSIGYSLFLRVFVCIVAVWNKQHTFISVIPAYWFSVCCLTKLNIPHRLFSVQKDERMLEYGGVELTEEGTLVCTVTQF